jgi:hypothetical protein
MGTAFLERLSLTNILGSSITKKESRLFSVLLINGERDKGYSDLVLKC